MSEPTLQCEINANFNQNYTKNCSFFLKWLFCFLAKGKSKFSRFPSKSVL